MNDLAGSLYRALMRNTNAMVVCEVVVEKTERVFSVERVDGKRHGPIAEPTETQARVELMLREYDGARDVMEQCTAALGDGVEGWLVVTFEILPMGRAFATLRRIPEP